MIPLVARRFVAHPGRLSETEWWLPTTHAQTLAVLRCEVAYFSHHGPSAQVVATLDRMDRARRKRLFAAADAFIDKVSE